jgi:hypothetical protein
MKNWKTTVTGVLAGLGISLGQLSALLSNRWSQVSWPTLLAGMLVALLGVLAKNAEKTSIRIDVVADLVFAYHPCYTGQLNLFTPACIIGSR